MAPSVVCSLTRRDSSSDGADQSKLTPILIIGIVVAAVLVAAIGIWFIIRYFRKKSAANREDARGAAFLNVRGLVKEGEKRNGLEVKGTFSRNQMDESVIMPEKTLQPNASRDEIIAHYTAEGKLPRPFAPFMAGGGTVTVDSGSGGSKRQSTASFLSIGRNSWISSARSSRRFSVASVSSTTSTATGGGKRKIRQLFNPVLPDELVVSLGEQLTVVNSFDDGWCIVGRDSVFKPDEIELGAIPAWCFMKPVQGLRAERPMRTSSLGVTINLEAGPGTREEVMSWSNF